MSFSTARLFAFKNLVFISALIATAQQSYNITGELTTENSTSLDQFTVEVLTAASHSAVARVFVTSSGRFQIRSLAPGEYRLDVKDRAGDVVMRTLWFPPSLQAIFG
jgi:hypothetical protein